jgi:hypothetical protein
MKYHSRYKYTRVVLNLNTAPKLVAVFIFIRNCFIGHQYLIFPAFLSR